jgi:TolB-like protein
VSDLFISYARECETQAHALAEHFRALGFSVWRDDSLPSHRPYTEVIEEELTQAGAVIAVWTVEAVRSQWVRSEADRARNAGKLVQLRLDDARLPMPFDQIQCADLVGWSGDARHPGLARVEESVRALIQPRSAEDPAAAERPEQAHSGLVTAILPFDDPAANPAARDLADALGAAITTQLSRLEGWTVLGRPEAQRLKAEGPRAWRAVGVSHVVDGAVRISGARARVTINVTDAATNAALWGERFDRESADIFELEDDLGPLIIKGLEAVLRPLVQVAAPPPVRKRKSARGIGSGERRHLTVVDAQLQMRRRDGASLDPEVAHEINSEIGRAARRLARDGAPLSNPSSPACWWPVSASPMRARTRRPKRSRSASRCAICRGARTWRGWPAPTWSPRSDRACTRDPPW